MSSVVNFLYTSLISGMPCRSVKCNTFVNSDKGEDGNLLPHFHNIKWKEFFCQLFAENVVNDRQAEMCMAETLVPASC
jgi:hypothetical protein